MCIYMCENIFYKFSIYFQLKSINTSANINLFLGTNLILYDNYIYSYL